MRHMRHLVAAATLVLAADTASAATMLYSSVYVFGDSLVDAGNARAARLAAGLSDPAPPAAGYVNGRFSNGLNFADYVSQAVTATMQPTTAAFVGGRNYAVGGADAASPVPLPPPNPANPRSPSFLEQIGLFGAQTIASDALVIVTFGGNDVRDTFSTPGMLTFDNARNDFRSGLNALIGAGARNIVVTGLPDIGAIPETALRGATAQQATLLTQRSEYLNTQFDLITSDVRQTTGADLDFFDLLTFERAVLTAPTNYGLPANLNTTTPCQFVPGAVQAGCGGFLYFDPIHPTTQVHQALAGGILAAIAVPEPSTWAMLIAGFGAIGASLRRKRRRSTAPVWA